MTSLPVLVRRIAQKDNFTFTIEWSDRKIQDIRLCDLQRECHCASCVDEHSGKRLLDKNSVDSNVRALKITSVGRYAIKVQFTSGCSNGIYSFDCLRALAKETL